MKALWEKLKPRPCFGVTKDLSDDLEAMKPGRMSVLKRADGVEFVVMHRDDAEHILALAGLKLEFCSTSSAGAGNEP